MLHVLSILTPKKNRSTNKNSSKNAPKKAHANKAIKSTFKSKSKPSIFSKITDTFLNSSSSREKTDAIPSYTNNSVNAPPKSKSFVSLFQHIRGEDGNRKPMIKSGLSRKPTYASDGYFEHYQYQQKRQELAERNIHTVPINQKKSILIERSGTNPESIKDKKLLNQSQAYPSTSASLAISENLPILKINDSCYGMPLETEIKPCRLSKQWSTDNDAQETITGAFNENLLNFDLMNSYSILDNIIYCSESVYSDDASSDFKIWDDEFWMNPDDVQRQLSQEYTITESTSANTNSCFIIKSILQNGSDQHPEQPHISDNRVHESDEPPIRSRFQRMNIQKSEMTMVEDNNSTYIVKKGRFEIFLDNNQPAPKDCVLPTSNLNP